MHLCTLISVPCHYILFLLCHVIIIVFLPSGHFLLVVFQDRPTQLFKNWEKNCCVRLMNLSKPKTNQLEKSAYIK